MLKKLAMTAILMSCVTSLSASPTTKNLKQLDYRTITSNNSVEEWSFAPPYTGYGFGQYPNDHRIQKIIVHVNKWLKNSNKLSGLATFECNGTSFDIYPGQTVVCERSLDNTAELDIVLNDKFDKPAAEGTVKFIMEDI